MSAQSISSQSAGGATSAGFSPTTTGTNAMGKDVFLRLLVSQLQNQDPLNPSDPTEFTAQLAQFASLEQLSAVNENLYALKLYQASINNAQAVSFIGKEILANGNEIQKTGDQKVKCEFDLSAEAKSVVVSIYDKDGNFVADVKSSSLKAGRQGVEWDGRDKNGNLVKDGVYTFKIQAEDAAGKPVAASPLTRGKVTGVTFDGFTPVLMIGDRRVPFGNVIQVSEQDT
jgi:flagellar basal-body rod modification protein FlgD